jgi:hypothetical protein
MALCSRGVEAPFSSQLVEPPAALVNPRQPNAPNVRGGATRYEPRDLSVLLSLPHWRWYAGQSPMVWQAACSDLPCWITLDPMGSGHGGASNVGYGYMRPKARESQAPDWDVDGGCLARTPDSNNGRKISQAVTPRMGIAAEIHAIDTYRTLLLPVAWIPNAESPVVLSML